MKNLFISLAILCDFFLIDGVCLAAEEAGQDPLLCAITEVVECDVLGTCLDVMPDSVGLPDFVVIDLANKQLKEASDGGVRTTRIDAVNTAKGKTSFGGLESGRGWSAVLSSGNRYLSATVTDDLVGFVIFGACVPKP